MHYVERMVRLGLYPVDIQLQEAVGQHFLFELGEEGEEGGWEAMGEGKLQGLLLVLYDEKMFELILHLTDKLKYFNTIFK